MRIALTLSFVLSIACPAPAPTPTTPTTPRVVAPPAQVTSPTALVPGQPTLRLPKNFVPASYAATLSIDPATTTFEGVIAITAAVTERSSVIWLHGRDLQIRKATVSSGATLTVTPRGEDLLEVRAEPALEPGTWVVSLDYSGKLSELETAGAFRQTVGGASYVFTQLEALYARRVFPCVDEPDSKVPWQLTLDVPTSSIAVSNTPIARETVIENGRRFEFVRTKPLPSYLVAFGIGPFDVVDAGKSKSGIPVRILTMKGRGTDAAYAAQTTARILDLAEEWFGVPYPYDKLDMLTVPLTVGFSAMENAGLITTTERLILFDSRKPSWEQRRGYIGVTAHEIAHQWFGDYVTMAWWDDLWLNEGFASWLGRKLTVRFEPAWHDELGELDMRISALESDSIVSARKVRQPIVTPDDIHNAFDGITYSKGGSVLNMFEAYVGADVFQRGVREYLKARAFGNATSTHFVAAISAAAGKDLAPAFSTFLDQAGAPEIDAKLACKGTPRLELEQQRFLMPGSPEVTKGTPWIVPICVAYERDGKRAEACTLLAEETATLALDTKTCPRWVMTNANGRGHYRARYTAAQATALRDEAWPHLTWTERRAVFFDVVAASRYRPRGMRVKIAKPPSGKMPLALVASFVPKLLAGGNRFTISDALGVPFGLDRFVADDQRGKFETWMRATFGPGAAKLGLSPKDSDDLDAESSRTDLIRAVAWSARDPELVAKCSELAQSWRDLPPAGRGQILAVAVDASPDLFAKILRDVKTEQDRARREEMIGALAAVRDPKRVEAAFELLLDPTFDFRESGWMLVGTTTEATRKVAERFVRVHKTKLLARTPKDAVTGVAGMWVGLFTSACDPTTRDEVAKYVTETFGTLAGGKRSLEQHIEAMDQCIATRKLVEPELKAFLAGVKIPKAKDKPAKP